MSSQLWSSSHVDGLSLQNKQPKTTWLFPATFDIIGENVRGVEELTTWESCAHSISSYNLKALYMHLLGVGFQHVTGLTRLQLSVVCLRSVPVRRGFTTRKHCYLNLSSHHSSLPENLQGGASYEWRKCGAFNKWRWDKWGAIWKNDKVGSMSHIVYQNEFQMDKRFKC